MLRQQSRMSRQMDSPALRLGSGLLAVSSFGLLAAPIIIVRNIPDLSTRASRHAFAGALALIAVAIFECVLALIPIRRGEAWALVLAAVPFALVGVPVLFVDAAHVAPERLWNTLAPQVAGLVVGAAALTICAVGRNARRRGGQ